MVFEAGFDDVAVAAPQNEADHDGTPTHQYGRRPTGES
jgi:hypothetical protein